MNRRSLVVAITTIFLRGRHLLVIRSLKGVIGIVRADALGIKRLDGDVVPSTREAAICIELSSLLIISSDQALKGLVRPSLTLARYHKEAAGSLVTRYRIERGLAVILLQPCDLREQLTLAKAGQTPCYICQFFHGSSHIIRGVGEGSELFARGGGGGGGAFALEIALGSDSLH